MLILEARRRGMSLHKLMRLMTIAFAGEGYLAFMGNEVGLNGSSPYMPNIDLFTLVVVWPSRG